MAMLSMAAFHRLSVLICCKAQWPIKSCLISASVGSVVAVRWNLLRFRCRPGAHLISSKHLISDYHPASSSYSDIKTQQLCQRFNWTLGKASTPIRLWRWYYLIEYWQFWSSADIQGVFCVTVTPLKSMEDLGEVNLRRHHTSYL